MGADGSDADHRLLLDAIAEELGVAFVFGHFGDAVQEPEQARIREVATSVTHAMVAAYRLERRDRPITGRQIHAWEAQPSEDPDDLIALELSTAFARGRFGEDIGDPDPEKVELVAGLIASSLWYAFRLELRDLPAG